MRSTSKWLDVRRWIACGSVIGSMVACGGTGPDSETSSAQALTQNACSTPTQIKASYVESEGPTMGHFEIRWANDQVDPKADSITIRGSLGDVDLGEVTLARPQQMGGVYTTPWRIQDSLSLEGTITAKFTLTATCANSVRSQPVTEQVTFIDPVRKCPTATESTLSQDQSSFYVCAEKWADHGRGCGEDGYLVGRGQKYAERSYRQTRTKMSYLGKSWIDHTIICLQEHLAPEISLASDCDTIRKTAYENHSDCYAQSGICTLPWTDLYAIAKGFDLTDVLNIATFQQFLGVVARCGGRHELFARRLSSGTESP